MIEVESAESVRSFLRSVYRYTQLLELGAPDILIEMEDNILIKRMKALEPSEVVLAFMIWEEFFEQQVVEDAELDERIDLDMQNMPPN